MALLPGLSALNEVYLMGTRLNINVRDAILSASIDSGTDRISQLELEFADPNFRILSSGVIASGMRVNFVGYDLEISNIATGGSGSTETVNFKARPLMYRRLDNRRGSKVMRKVSPSDFVISECNAVGASYLVQPSARRNQVARDVPQKGSTESTHTPSTWTTFQRLANELNFLLFESRNKLYFGERSWLVNNIAAAVPVGYKTGPEQYRTETIPQCKQSLDDPNGTMVSFELPLTRFSEMFVGRAIDLTGVPTFNARYMVESVSCDLLSPTARISVDSRRIGSFAPVVEAGVRKNTKSAEDFVYWSMQQLGDRYQFGVEVRPEDPDPVAFDASELVAWASAQVGIALPDEANEQIAFCTDRGGEIPVADAVAIRGALLWYPGHIAISIGGGKVVEALESKLGVVTGDVANRFQKAAKIPGMIYGR